MTRAKKSWAEKLRASHGLPKVVRITGKMRARWGTGTVAIPAPVEVDELMRKVPRGKLITINELRNAIARRHKATIGCPITCGIFAWIAAHAAEEQRAGGEKWFTPWWRTLKSDGSLNEKYPGGVETQKALLKKEGHTIIRKGKRLFVEGFEK